MDTFNYNMLCKNITDGSNFTFSRWGDGEFAALMGDKGRNTDKHQYFADMGDQLKAILHSNPPYYMGIQPLVMQIRKDDVDKFNGIDWVEADMLHIASINEQLTSFFAALATRGSVTMVAPDRLRNIKEFKWNKFIEVPLVNCWNDADSIYKEIVKANPNDVILYCASMMSNVLMDKVYALFGDTITQIDCGSVFEPYIGIANRVYHKKMLTELNKK